MARKKQKQQQQQTSKQNTKIDGLLRKIYYDTRHPAAYGSVKNLAKASGLSKRTVEQWLTSQPTYVYVAQNETTAFPDGALLVLCEEAQSSISIRSGRLQQICFPQ